MKYISEEQIIEINKRLTKQLKIIKPNELNSASNNYRQSMFGSDLYPTIEEKSSNLFYSLVMNHCFADGNKRTAIVSMLVFLKANNYSITYSNASIAHTVIGIIEKRITKEEFIEYIRKGIKEEI